MIYIGQKQLKQVEYLIQQSMQGHHVLFDNETLRKLFHDDATHWAPGAVPIESMVEKLMAEPTLERKREYLQKLQHEDSAAHDQVIRVYFNIIENNLWEQNGRLVH